jgi:hypothetical protein
MPRPSSFRSEVLAQPAQVAVYAAAKNYTIGKARKGVPGNGGQTIGEGWQDAVWDFYDEVGEFRYAVDWVGNLLSRAILHVTENGAPSTNSVAVEAMAALFGGPEGQSEMLRSLGIHYTVAGEAYVVGVDQGDADGWYVVASTEIRRSGENTFKVPGLNLEISDGDSLVMRLWRAHPRQPWKANAPSRAILAILSEITKLTMHVAAQLDSRLTGAGLLILPSERSVPTVPTGDSTDETSAPASTGAQGFVDMLINVMETAIGNRQDASALVPIVLQVAGEYIDKVQHLTFWSELDKQAVDLRNEAIRRLALGMDMPPEVLTGIADVNHWGAWQVDESSIKAHSEPLLKAITSALTIGYLRPVLEAEGMDPEEAMNFAIGADTSQLRMRPNRSKESIELHAIGELKAETMRRENGFTEEDAPDDEERRDTLIRRVASGSASPEQVEAALRLLGIQIVTVAGDDMRETPPAPSIADHPETGIPEETVAAAEQMVFRALERAGNRLKNRLGGKTAERVDAVALYLRMPEITATEAGLLLEDAWSSCTWTDHGVEPAALEHALNAYTTALLVQRAAHDRELLRTYLADIPTTRHLVAI